MIPEVTKWQVKMIIKIVYYEQKLLIVTLKKKEEMDHGLSTGSSVAIDTKRIYVAPKLYHQV